MRKKLSAINVKREFYFSKYFSYTEENVLKYFICFCILRVGNEQGIPVFPIDKIDFIYHG